MTHGASCGIVMSANNPFNIGPVRPKKEHKMKYNYGTMLKNLFAVNTAKRFFFLPETSARTIQERS